MTTVTILLSGLLIGFVYACIALGFSVAMGACRVVNFAHGNFVILGAYVGYSALTHGLPIYAALPFAALIAGLLGMACYYWLILPLAKTDVGLQIAVSLGMAIVLESALALIFGADPVSSAGAWPSRSVIALGDFRLELGRLIAGVAGLVAIWIAWWIFERSRWGIAIQAAGENVTGAELTGYNAGGVLLTGFGLSTALAGLAGVLILPVANVSPYDARDYTLRSFVIILVGGLGNFPGILITGAVIGLIQSAGGYFASPDIGTVSTYALLLAALCFRRMRSGLTTLSVGER